MKSFKKRIVISGNFVDVYYYSERQFYDYEKFPVKVRSLSLSGFRSNFADTRASDKIRCLVNANPKLKMFVTLNFAKNIRDLTFANYEFKKFMQKLKYRFVDFKYIAIVEFQKRGSIHYHLVCSIPFIDIQKIENLWGWGQFDIIEAGEPDDMGAYFVKELKQWQNLGSQFSKHGTKDKYKNEAKKLSGRKKYFCSRYLEKPIYIKDIKKVKTFSKKLKNKKAKKIVEWMWQNCKIVKKSFKI